MSRFQPDDSERHGNHEAGVIYPFQPPSFGSHPQTLNREVEQARNTLQAVTVRLVSNFLRVALVIQHSSSSRSTRRVLTILITWTP